MPKAADARNPYLVPIDARPGDAMQVIWDVANQTVEYAQILCARMRAAGATVVACSLDAKVKRGNKCPVCGADGLA